MFKKIIYISLICLMVLGAGITAKAGAVPQLKGLPAPQPQVPLSGSGSGFLPNPLRADTFAELFTAIAAWAFSIVGLLAVVMIIVGGFQYIISAGEEAKIKEAKNTIRYAVIGLAVVLGSYAILAAIKDILGMK